ncbi:type II secretion system major pseudopilin GspG [soil metagenome]
MQNDAESGFTLVELLVVLVILVLLASLIGPRVIGYLGSSRSKSAGVQIQGLSTSLELYYLDMGRYPSTAEGLAALVEKPPSAATWNGPYLSKQAVPLDPWGKPYSYEQPGKKARFDLYSLGRDNKEGGTGEDGDLWN